MFPYFFGRLVGSNSKFRRLQFDLVKLTSASLTSLHGFAMLCAWGSPQVVAGLAQLDYFEEAFLGSQGSHSYDLKNIASHV